MILLVFTAIVLLKGWPGWVWASHGLEKLRVEQGVLLYEREGSLMDHKRIEVPLGDISGIVVLWPA
jgi:hypothetical protein